MPTTNRPLSLGPRNSHRTALTFSWGLSRGPDLGLTRTRSGRWGCRAARISGPRRRQEQPEAFWVRGCPGRTRPWSVSRPTARSFPRRWCGRLRTRSCTARLSPGKMPPVTEIHPLVPGRFTQDRPKLAFFLSIRFECSPKARINTWAINSYQCIMVTNNDA